MRKSFSLKGLCDHDQHIPFNLKLKVNIEVTLNK